MNRTSGVLSGRLAFLVFPFILTLSACLSTTTNHQSITPPSNKQYTDEYNRQLTDTAISMLRSGDIALRKGAGADSRLLAMLNKKDGSWSHCGIVMIENGYPFVYHSIGGEDNPEARLRRDSASFFFSPLHNMAIAVMRYDYSSGAIGRLRDTVSWFYRKKPRFDLKFDLATDDYLYCSEFVYKAVIKATGDTAYIGTSSLSGGRYVAIDDLFINPHARVIWQTQFKQYLYQLK